MFLRPVLIAILAAGPLGACTVSSDRPYSGSSASNPPGWVDRDRNGVDDRTQRSGYNSSGYNSGYQGGYYDRWGNWHSYR